MPERDRATAPAPPQAHEVPHVTPVEVLADVTVAVAREVEHAVLGNQGHADRAITAALRTRRGLALSDRRFVSQAVFALFRWRGWIEPLRIPRAEGRLLLAWLLDAPGTHPVCRVWARKIGREIGQLVAVGDAPNWTARAEGLKRFSGGRTVNADPWQLFPGWLREVVPLPPGGSSPKLKYLELLQALQTRAPLWVRAQVKPGEETALWNELRDAGLKPWVHRQVASAAKLPADSDVPHLPAFERGAIEIQDLASQAVALACDPDPGDRWWDACAGAGGKSLHLAALMGGKGVVVATDIHAGRLKETVRRARRSPWRNVTTKSWDGKHVAGKSKSFDGVLVDAPCSAIGTWRRNPDARWTTTLETVDRLAVLQAQILHAAAPGVRPGGTLVYSVCTLTPAETHGVVKTFLEAHPDFHLDPFPHPLSGGPTDGTLLIWPQETDTDAMFIARMVRTG